MPKILFVCTGNTCRSPMAAAMAGMAYKEFKNFSFLSRGISVPVPSRATENAILSVRALTGADIKSHISRQLNEKDLQDADLIITMTHSHKEYLTNIFSDDVAGKVFTLYEICDGSGKNIKDPFGGDAYTYRKCAEEIRNCLDRMFFEKLLSIIMKNKEDA